MSDALGRTLESPLNQPAVPRSSIKRGQETVTITSEDMLDKIINLRFIHKPKTAGTLPRTFTLRSDYEPLFNRQGGYRYIISLQKPHIKIEFKQVANDTVIELNVEVTNLFVKDPSTMEADQEPLQQVEIQMGYRSQMPDWTAAPWNEYPISDFYALRDNNVTTNSRGRVSATKLVAQILSTERLSTPPDMVTRFRCVVGTVESGLRWLFDEASLTKDILAQKSAAWGTRVIVNNLPDTFFALITRRFVRSTVRHDIHDQSVPKNDPETGREFTEVVQTVTIFNSDDTILETLSLEAGRMSSTDADKYGVAVYLSQVLWDNPLEELPNWGLTEKEVAQAVPVEQPIVVEMQDKAPAQLNAIVKQYPFIRFYTLSDGNYYAYHVQEESQEFFKDPFIYAKQVESIIKLPAVYDISWGGTRQIRAPFISILGSMKTVAFQAKYALNDITGNFYHPKPENNCFLVLLNDVSFDTTGEANMMELTCVDIAGTYRPVTNPDGSISPVAPPVAPGPAVRTKIWKKQDLTVIYDFRGNPNTTDSSWMSVINRLLATAVQYKALWGGTLPDKNDALDFLEDENPDLFAAPRLAAYVSTESASLGRNVPVLFASAYNPVNPGDSDIIHVRFPFLPSYESDEEILS